jgi:hypothetical protein
MKLMVQTLRRAAASTAFLMCSTAAQAHLCGFEKLTAGTNRTARLYFVSSLFSRDYSIRRANGESYSIHVQLGVFLDEHSEPRDRDPWGRAKYLVLAQGDSLFNKVTFDSECGGTLETKEGQLVLHTQASSIQASTREMAVIAEGFIFNTPTSN